MEQHVRRKGVLTMSKGALRIVCLLFTVLLMLMGCSEKEEQSLKIKDFKIQPTEQMCDAECAEFLTAVVKEGFNVKMKTGADEEQENWIYLVNNPEYAESLGYSFEEMDEDAFVIYNQEDSVYILSPEADGVKRAASYFVNNMLEEDGTLLLTEGETYTDIGKDIKESVCIGDTPISEYAIAYSSEAALEASEELRYYIQQTGNDYLEIVSQEGYEGSAIYLTLDETLEKGSRDLKIQGGQVYITAADKKVLLDGVHLFLDTYLGWIKTGEADAHMSSASTVVNVPVNVQEQTPWIEEREAIVCLWNVNYTRGATLDEDISLKNNIIDFTEDQLYEYVKMLKYCGFTGIQVTEMCSTWAGVGDYEIAHEKIRTLAEAAHSLDMKFTLWVWGAEFTDCGWVDDTVTYERKEYDYPHMNPDVVASFDKYYSIYAELADCCDRVIGHYYDPGNLHTAEDIAFFAKMLKDKFQAINPDIDFGISCWVDIYDKNIFIDALGTDITLYECGHHDNEKEYETFRQEIADFGCRLGTWAWNTCEMEIDQLAQMNFNMEVIRSVYQTARKYDDIAKPSYWSEMDSYHLLNVFSLYCAGQMLINPDIESEVLFEQIAEATVGYKYANDFAEILSIIQDARSGYSWDTYFWSSENYVLKSDEYPAEQILSRCNAVMPVLQEMIDNEIECNFLPLPISLNDLLQMIRPHLEQIRSFAEFRIALAQLEADYAQGANRRELAVRLEEIADPIKDYNCIIGAWGQIEARAQYEMVTDFCGRTGVDMPENKAFHENRKNYIQNQLISYQKNMQSEPYILESPYYQLGLAYGQAETDRLVEELVQEGIFIRNADGSVYLADWENYIYHFE